MASHSKQGFAFVSLFNYVGPINYCEMNILIDWEGMGEVEEKLSQGAWDLLSMSHASAMAWCEHPTETEFRLYLCFSLILSIGILNNAVTHPSEIECDDTSVCWRLRGTHPSMCGFFGSGDNNMISSGFKTREFWTCTPERCLQRQPGLGRPCCQAVEVDWDFTKLFRTC